MSVRVRQQLHSDVCVSIGLYGIGLYVLWLTITNCPPDTEDGPYDASFQSDPEHYHFMCLSSEETWNYLDSQARDASKAIKVTYCG